MSRVAMLSHAPAPVLGLTSLVPPLRRRRPWLFVLCIAWMALAVLVAILAGILPVGSPVVPAGAPRLPPFKEAGTLLLGTDAVGRSMLARVAYGARISLTVGALAAGGAAFFGALMGIVAGYVRGWVDESLTFLADALLAFPPLVFLLALTAVLRPSLPSVVVGLTVLAVPTFTRLSRASTLVWREREYVLAARALGASDYRIVLREILPNVLVSLLAFLPTVVAALIVAEGSLSFLGLGIPPPVSSWGGMIADGRNDIADFPYLVLVPSVPIFLTVFALNVIGETARRALDQGPANN